jgi:hypothetical protein
MGATLAASLVALLGGLALGSPLGGVVAALALVTVMGTALVVQARAEMARMTSSDTLGAIGRAVADALAATGRVDAAAGAERVRVMPQDDGYLRCLLESVSETDAGRFADAMEDVLAPLWEPRWIIGRQVLVEPASTAGALRILLASLPGARTRGWLVYHTVPGALAGSRERVEAFERAWGRWVSPGQRAVRASDPAGEGILAAHRAEDPFRLETQRRTLWT